MSSYWDLDFLQQDVVIDQDHPILINGWDHLTVLNLFVICLIWYQWLWFITGWNGAFLRLQIQIPSYCQRKWRFTFAYRRWK